MRRASLLLAASTLGPTWIAAAHLRRRRSARPLSLTEHQAMAEYFSPRVLARVRLADAVGPLGIAPLAWIRRLGFRDPAMGNGAAGLTLGHLVLIADPVTSMPTDRWQALLFHELVHVTQFDHLGVARMCRRYVAEWHDAGCVYLDIGLEQAAYALQERFESDPGRPFDADREIRDRLRPTSA